jgi:hypothetical protein
MSRGHQSERGFDVARHETSDVVIRDRRYRRWPGLVLLVGLGFVWLIVAGLIIFWLPGESGKIVIVGAMLAFGVSGGIAQHWIPHPVSRVNLGLFLETWPGGMRYRPSNVTQISFGPDPAEDYVESFVPVHMCQAMIHLRDGTKFALVVTADDAGRLRDWAVQKEILVNDPDGYATGSAGKDSSS